MSYFSRSRIKRLYATSSLCALYLGIAGVSMANPEGGVVSGGVASIESAGNRVDVHQQTDKAVIDWRSFDIGVNEITQFHQPSSAAVTLNRVGGVNPSNILGQLKANGNLILINPNGVFFGSSARVDVNGLIASTADISNQHFMAGHLNFAIAGNPDATIINHGTITARDAGLVGLVAPQVENYGVIRAQMGRVELASGDTFALDLYGDGLLSLAVSDQVQSQLVGNSGVIEAAGGEILLSAAAGRDIVNSLITVSGELHAPTVSEHQGRIVIAAAGSNAVAGNDDALKGIKQGESRVEIAEAFINVSGRDIGEQGGSIEITGDDIALLNGTIIDASGHSAPEITQITQDGSATLSADNVVRSEADFLSHQNRAGGSIKIGGDYLGSGDTATARNLFVDEAVLVLNDATTFGDAGRTIFWSDGDTDFRGLVLARGGVLSGNGGFLETSGAEFLSATGFADLSAPNGQRGTYLLDPTDITIFGNVDPQFQSSDGSIDLATSNVLDLFADAGSIFNAFVGASGVQDGAFNAGSAVNSGDVTRNRSAVFAAFIDIPSNPVGTIYEQGASGFGAWVGFLANGDFVVHAGRGNFAAADAANLVIPAASAPSGTGVLSWEIDLGSNSVTAYWNDMEIGSDTAASNFSSWAGSNVGNYGSANGVPTGANSLNFNGSLLSTLIYYGDDLATATAQPTTFGGVSDLSPANNNPVATSGSVVIEAGLINGQDVLRLNNNVTLNIADTNTINEVAQSGIGRSFTFRTDNDVNARQILYNEGGGTNGYVVYVQNNTLNVGLYNGGFRVFRQIPVTGDTDYHVSSSFSAADNEFIVTVNGTEYGGTAFGVGVNFAAHGGDIDFGAVGNDAVRDVNGGTLNENETISILADAIFYNDSLSTSARHLIEQYSSAEFDIALDAPGTGATEVAQATAPDGYSVFAATYLERLSQSANIVLQADNSITLDLQGATLNLFDDRSLTLTTTNGNILTASDGTIRTNRTGAGGNITFNAGGTGNILIDHLLTLDAQNGGETRFIAGGGNLSIGALGVLNVTQNNLLLETPVFNNAGDINSDITWRSNQFASANFSGTAEGIVVEQATASNSLAVGTGGASDVTINTATVTALQGSFTEVTFGRVDGGNVSNFFNNYQVGTQFLSAGDFINEATISSVGTLQAIAGNNVILNAAIDTSSAANNALVLAAGNRFLNQVGSTALQADNSRWLVYSASPLTDTINGLMPDASDFDIRFSVNPPATIADPGNRFLYALETLPASPTTDILPNTVEVNTQTPVQITLVREQQNAGGEGGEGADGADNATVVAHEYVDDPLVGLGRLITLHPALAEQLELNKEDVF